MAATMPKNAPKRQQQSAPRRPVPRGTPEPPWLGTALVAIRVMTVLIIIALALLGYGIWDKYYADSGDDTAAADTAAGEIVIPSNTRFAYPADMRFYQIATTADGGMVVVLEGADGNFTAITLDAAGREVSRLAIERLE